MQTDGKLQEQMFGMITAWKDSGLSQKAYCGQQAIRYHVFHYWYRRYREAELSADNAGFVPVSIQLQDPLPSPSGFVELLLPNGNRLVFHQPVSADFLKSIIS